MTTDLSLGLTPTDLAGSLIGAGVTSIANVQYTGADLAAGSFSGGTSIIGFESGALLTSGLATNVIGPNDAPNKSHAHNLPGDADLDGLIPGLTTHDASVLSFDLVPNGNVLTLRYVFASEEYNEYVGSEFNDVFGLFVNGVNYARLPGSNSAVTINNVNGPANSQFFVDNTGATLDTQLDGLTVVLTMTAPVNPGATNQVKIAIADASDRILDSAVFLEALSILSTDGNLPPTLDPIGNQTVNLGETLTFTATATDGDAPPNNLRFSLEGAPAGAVIDPITGAFSWTPTLLAMQAPGAYSFIVRVTDDGSPSFFDEERITVTVIDPNPNQPPSIVLGGSFGAETDDFTQQFTWSVTDDVGLSGVAIGVAVVGPDGVIFDSSDASGSFNFDGYGLGNFAFAVTAIDIAGLSASASSSATIGDDDTQGPVIVLGGSTGQENDGQPQQFTWNASDAAGLASVSVTVTKDGNEVFTSTDASGTFNFDAYGLGNFVLTVTATDADSDWSGDSLSASISSSATISDDDTAAPIIIVGGSSGDENDGQTQEFTWNASDASGLSSVSVTVTQDGNEVFTSTDASGTFDFNALGLGNFVLTVTATDADSDWGGDSLTASVSSSATISDDDTQGPVIVLGGSSGTENEAQLQEFTWDVSDDSGLSSLEVVITQDTGSGPVEIFRTEDPADALSSFNFDSYGVGTFEITVTTTDGDGDWSGDGSDASATRSVTVTAGNSPPVLFVPGPFTVDEGQTLTFQVSATDPDGDPLTFTGSNLPTGATFDPATLTYNSSTQTWSQTFTWTPGCDQAGTYQLSFLADDGRGGTDTGDVHIDVADVPAQQHIEAISEQVAGLSELNPGQRNSLLAKLDNASASLDRDNTRAAVGQLQAFGNQVDTLLGRPNLSESTKEELREIQAKVAELLVCLQVAAAQPRIVSIQYVDPQTIPWQERGRYGELSQDNPATMGGGWRIFPDAVGNVINGVVTGNNDPHNLLRIRVVVAGANAETVVSFRSFDVDDPSSNTTIDPNDPLVGGVRVERGADNRGYLQQTAQYDRPADSFAPTADANEGYRGMLRTVGGNFPAPRPQAIQLGNLLEDVPVRWDRENRQWIAEVELAVSYAPGDNFRVAASVGSRRTAADQPRKVDDLFFRTDVPTTGAIQNFDGMVTDQLSVWRHVHVEYDRMERTDGDSYSGRVTKVVREAGNTSRVTVRLTAQKYQRDLKLRFQSKQFDNGFLQIGTDYFKIFDNFVDPADRQQLVVELQIAGQPNLQIDQKVTVFDDDWKLVNNSLVPQINPYNIELAQVRRLMEASPDAAVNRYAAAYIQPEYVQLQPFNTDRPTTTAGRLDNPVPARTHLNTANAAPPATPPPDPENNGFDLLHSLHGAAGARTELYWTVYVAMAFQGPGNGDGDPPGDPLAVPPIPGQSFVHGLSKGRAASGTLSYTALFAETARDLIATAPIRDNPHGVTFEQLLARDMVHEVGHQFGLVDPRDPNNDGSNHRLGQNLMAPAPSFYPDNQYVFAPEDIVFLRNRRPSP